MTTKRKANGIDYEEAIRKNQHAKMPRGQRMYTRVTRGSAGAAAAAAAPAPVEQAGGTNCVNFTVVAKDKQDKKVFPLDIEAGLQLLAERVAEWQGVPVSKIKLWFPAECDFVSLMDMVEDIGDAGDEVTFELR